MVVAIVVIAALNVRSGGSGAATAAPSGATSASQDVAPTGSPGGGSSALGLTAPTTPIPASIPRDGRTLGSPDAKVVLDLWEDFQCPFCGTFTGTIEPTIVERYVQPGRLRISFHDFSFIGRESEDAASAARCADQQGKFWDYESWVYANQNGENQGWFSRDRLAGIAGRIGLDPTAWSSCYDGSAQRAAVTAETQVGQAAGVSSTPTLFLAGTLVPLSSFKTWDDLYAAIDAAIAAAGGGAGATAPPSASSGSGAP